VHAERHLHLRSAPQSRPQQPIPARILGDGDDVDTGGSSLVEDQDGVVVGVEVAVGIDQ